MEEIVMLSGIAKTTIYRHFPTKDVLIAAFLELEDQEFWSQWEETERAGVTPLQKLDALCDWVGERVGRDGYRGCPQLNIAAEFPDADHPARRVARRHKTEMYRRLRELCYSLHREHADVAAMQIALLFDGAFMNDGRLRTFDTRDLLKRAIRSILGIPSP
jgi:AcrR family transcriptional regulator